MGPNSLEEKKPFGYNGVRVGREKGRWGRIEVGGIGRIKAVEGPALKEMGRHAVDENRNQSQRKREKKEGDE